MFGKLVKHEFRATSRIIPAVFLLTVFLGIISILSILLNVQVLIGISVFILVFLSFAQIAITYALIAWRYYKTMCGNEAYLSYTLPVKPSLHLWCKLLVGFVWSTMSMIVFAVTIGGVGIAAYLKNDGSLFGIKELLNTIITTMGLSGYETALVLIFIGLILISIFVGLVEIYFAITLGSTAKFQKFGIGGPILVFVIQYFVLQIVNMLAMGLIPLAVKISMVSEEKFSFSLVQNNMVEWMIEQILHPVAQVSGEEHSLIGIGSFIILPILMAGFLYAASRIINRHTSVR